MHKLATIFNNIREGAYGLHLYDIFRDIDSVNNFYPVELFANKDRFDIVLYDLFDAIVKAGRKCYSTDRRFDSALNETNYLKKDNNYYNILKTEWDTLSEKIDTIFNNF